MKEEYSREIIQFTTVPRSGLRLAPRKRIGEGRGRISERTRLRDIGVSEGTGGEGFGGPKRKLMVNMLMKKSKIKTKIPLDNVTVVFTEVKNVARVPKVCERGYQDNPLNLSKVTLNHLSGLCGNS